MDKSGIGRMLKTLTEADGPSGGEAAVAQVVRSLAQAYASEVRTDALGSVIARRGGLAPQPPGRIMLVAHMDEIGLVVTKVEDGFLHLAKIGGVDSRSALGQEVTVYPSGPGSEHFPQGLAGFIGSRPPHVLSSSADLAQSIRHAARASKTSRTATLPAIQATCFGLTCEVSTSNRRAAPAGASQ